MADESIEVDQDSAVGLFQSITGADHSTAQHVLEAHGWDADRAVNFFMEAGSSMPTTAAQNDIDLEPRAQEMGFGEQAGSHGAPTHWQGAAHQAQEYDAVEDEEALQQALNESLRTNGDEDLDLVEPAAPRSTRQHQRHRSSSRTQSHPIDLEADSTDSDSLEEKENTATHESDDDIGAASSRRNPGRVHTRSWSNPAGTQRGFEAEYRGAGPGPGFVPGLPSMFPGLLDSESLLAQPDGTLTTMNGRQQSVELPDDINAEEARMLEAVMTGVPYEGRIPDFSRNGAAEPTSPTVVRQRELRREQDQAYQDSLLADRQKADAARAAQQAEEDARKLRLQEEEDAAQKQRDYEQEISDKLTSLPMEPGSDVPGAVTVLIRTPGGGRFGRRFLPSHGLRDLFNFVDVNAAPNFKPGTYQLVTQFPRKVIGPESGSSIADAGLTQKQEALFLEPL